MQVEEVEQHADAAGDGRLAGNDLIASRGQVVGSAGSGIQQASDDRFAGANLELLQVATHGTAGGDAATVAVNSQHDALHARIRFDGSELLAEQGHRVLPEGHRPHERRIENQPVHIQNRNSTGLSGLDHDRFERAGNWAHRAEIGDPSIDRPFEPDAALRLDDEAGAPSARDCNQSHGNKRVAHSAPGRIVWRFTCDVASCANRPYPLTIGQSPRWD